MCPRCNGDIRPWGVCQCDEKILKAHIAELRAENQRLRDALNAISHDAEDTEIVRMAVNALLGGGE